MAGTKVVEQWMIDFIKHNYNILNYEVLHKKTGLSVDTVARLVNGIKASVPMTREEKSILELHHTKSVIEIACYLKMDAGEIAKTIRRWE